MKNMVRTLHWGSCPNCGNRQFVVDVLIIDRYLTNDYGEVVRHKEVDYDARGMCTKCHKTYEMYETNYGFVPMTPLRKLLNYAVPEVEAVFIENPFDRSD